MSGAQTSVGAWEFLGATVPGSSHLRQGIPNQDSWASARLENALLLSVSDGHGSPHCFRSDVGSRFAVDTFIELLTDFLAGSYGEDLSLIKRLAEERLPGQIERQWQAKVMEYHQAHPVTEAEWARLTERKGPDSVRRMQDQPLMIYGATLLGVAITEHYLLYLQLGDGEIIEADGETRVSTVMPEDARLIANETTSLCRPEAWRDFRFRFQVLTEAAPVLILLTTDGYFNSFRERSGFYQVGSDLLDLLRSEGPDWVAHEMPGWLSEATHSGSGDDATLAIAWNTVGLAALPPLPPSAEETGPVDSAATTAVTTATAVTEAAAATEAVASNVVEPEPDAEMTADADTTAETEMMAETEPSPGSGETSAAEAETESGDEDELRESEPAPAVQIAEVDAAEAAAQDTAPGADLTPEQEAVRRKQEADMVSLIASADDD